MVKVSVIIPVYNAEKFIKRAVESVLNSSFRDFELICIDDGSTDNSWQILQDLAARDSRIKPLHKENEGVSLTRNLGLEKASGEFIYFMDADDCIHPLGLERMLSSLEEENADFVHIDFIDGKYNNTPDFKELPKEKKISITTNPLFDLFPYKRDIFFAPWAFMYRREILDGIHFVDALISDDIFFNALVLKKANKGVLLDEELYFYTYNQASIVHSEFSLRKAMSYLSVAEAMYNCFRYNPLFLKRIQASRINQNLKNVLKHFNEIMEKDPVIAKIKNMYKRRVISFKGLSLSKKLLLLKILLKKEKKIS